MRQRQAHASQITIGTRKISKDQFRNAFLTLDVRPELITVHPHLEVGHRLQKLLILAKFLEQLVDVRANLVHALRDQIIFHTTFHIR